MTDGPADPWLRRVASALLPALEELTPGWQLDGTELHSDYGTVRVADLHRDGGHGHVDLGISLAAAPLLGTLWDCTAGGAAKDETAARHVARLWCATTAPAVLELSARDGRFADHANHDPTLGLADWHSIHGALMAFGPASAGDDPIALRDWAFANPLVPAIAAELRPALASGSAHGVKFVIGDALGESEPIAEVRIDGDRHEACSAALLGLSWPRRRSGSVLRCFVLFVHR